MTYYQPYGYFRSDANILSDLATAINGEYTAIQCYEQLAAMAPNATVRDQILEIRKDEIKHYQTFTHLYHTLSGQQPQPTLNENCPKDYSTGVEFSFKDEQHTTDFYLEVYDRATDPIVKEAFRRAAADEQQHAVWFLYFMQKEQQQLK